MGRKSADHSRKSRSNFSWRQAPNLQLRPRINHTESQTKRQHLNPAARGKSATAPTPPYSLRKTIAGTMAGVPSNRSFLGSQTVSLLPIQPSRPQTNLPPDATITKRPIHRPAIPDPFSSSTSQKTLYINAHTPFIPQIKRIRKLLSEVERRERQSLHATGRQALLQANGRLDPKQVERTIAEATKEKREKGGEEVYVKATGKAIERALEIGVWFQKEGDCKVRVEIGSVKAIDDIKLGRKGGEEAEVASGDEGGVDANRDKSKAKEKRKGVREEDVPETRIRSLSAVTVTIGLK